MYEYIWHCIGKLRNQTVVRPTPTAKLFEKVDRLGIVTRLSLFGQVCSQD